MGGREGRVMLEVPTSKVYTFQRTSCLCGRGNLCWRRRLTGSKVCVARGVDGSVPGLGL